MQYKLLCFQPSYEKNELLDNLKENYLIYTVSDLNHVYSLVELHQLNVGIAYLPEKHNSSYLNQLEELFQRNQSLSWLMLLPRECLENAHQNQEKIIHLITDYCYDYHTLPVCIERLMVTLGHAYGMAEILRQLSAGQHSYQGKYNIIGKSLLMRRLFQKLDKVSREDSPVLITGETGTGKELIANAIHKQSYRTNKPLVAVNCGAIPANLIQSELFGYEKGAFTGAQQRKIGKIETAQGGSLFLDEIGDLPLEMQVNLLRFLQEGTIERVGGHEKIELDIRIIAATHVNLKMAVKEGKFREDLYYRLHVFHLEVPSLREREEDIVLLAWYFLQKFTSAKKYKCKGFSLESLQVIKNYDWPGNVRELENCIQRAVVMSENCLITPEDLGLERRTHSRILMSLDESRTEAEKQAIINALHYTNSNKIETAKLLDVSRATLYRLMEKYDLG